MKTADVKQIVDATAKKLGPPFIKTNYTAICRAAGLLPQELSDLVHGRRATHEAKDRLAKWLGIARDQLFPQEQKPATVTADTTPAQENGTIPPGTDAAREPNVTPPQP